MKVTNEMVFAALSMYYLRNERPDDITVWSDTDIHEMRAAIEAALAAAPQGKWVPVAARACIKPTHDAADAFWRYWRENGETHKRGYYESTWGAINAALAHGWDPPAPAAQPSATGVADLRDAKWLDPECADRGACQSLRFKAAQPSAEPELVRAARDALAALGVAADHYRTYHDHPGRVFQAAADALRRALEAGDGAGEARDAARYRLLRRGQRWSVVNGIGDTLRADALDAAIDAAMGAAPEAKGEAAPSNPPMRLAANPFDCSDVLRIAGRAHAR